MLLVNQLLDAPEHRRAGHPERPGRAGAAMAGIEDLHLGSELELVTPHPAKPAELLRVHDRAYLERLEEFCAAGGGDLDPDTYAVSESWSCATTAAGAGLSVLEGLRARGDGLGFVCARPPGHHALSDRAMGFCLLNNVAVAAAALVAHGERVLIVDWDVHHGNGTQELFWDDPHVLYVSTHQWPLFPGTGRAGDVGGPNALGYTVNVPLPPGSSGDTVLRALDEVAFPAVEVFGPTWVLVSAGFDAHRSDPMADLALSSADFARLATLVASFAPAPGRMVLFLEGGYDLEAIRSSVTATLGALLDAAPGTNIERSTSDELGSAVVRRAKAERSGALHHARERAHGDRILE